MNCKEMHNVYEAAKQKLATVLTYFGEETHVSSIDFFTTLNRFITVCPIKRDWEITS